MVRLHISGGNDTKMISKSTQFVYRVFESNIGSLMEAVIRLGNYTGYYVPLLTILKTFLFFLNRRNIATL